VGGRRRSTVGADLRRRRGPVGSALLGGFVGRLAGRMQFAVWELVEEGCLRPEPIEVLLAERLPLIAGTTIVVVPRC
jgi:hypothetical protein